MIGQATLCNLIDSQIARNTFPRCSIFVGPKGSGKKLIAKHVAKQLGADMIQVDGKIDVVRDVIKLAYTNYNKTVFVFTDAEKMSQNAENALLKLLEEPPNSAYIIITAISEYALLDTIKSRCVIMHMDRYTPDELFEYYWSLEGTDIMPSGMPNEAEIIRVVCETPGEVQQFIKQGVGRVYGYAELVFDNIRYVTGANALKIGNQIAFKDDDKDKIDITLFFKSFLNICGSRLDNITAQWVQITFHYLNQLSWKGVNKTMLFDNWVLDCRAVAL